MKKHLLLLAGTVAFIACENATEPEPLGQAVDEAVQLAPAAASQISSDGLVTHQSHFSSDGVLVVLGWCDEAAGVLHAAVPGTGTMAHVGRFDVQQSGCMDPATGAFSDGVGILTAANGDEMHVEFEGQRVATAPPTYELRYVVNGGTGRFLRAEGETDVLVTYTSETTWVAEGDGWIRYAASDRSNR